jgi:hypothetical protein
VLAADFVHAAEESGLSRMLTRLVLARALDELRAWVRAGRDLRVSVNTSVADLLDSDFPDEVAGALAERELPPGRLVLEVTESAVLSDLVRVLFGELRHVAARVADPQEDRDEDDHDADRREDPVDGRADHGEGDADRAGERDQRRTGEVDLLPCWGSVLVHFGHACT